jgi:photosystem II stability/assembly factor-like uncharacterized protein
MKISLLGKTCLPAVLLLYQQLSFGQTGWFWQNPLPPKNSYNGVSFIDANTGWAVGAHGTLVHTTNGG